MVNGLRFRGNWGFRLFWRVPERSKIMISYKMLSLKRRYELQSHFSNNSWTGILYYRLY